MAPKLRGQKDKHIEELVDNDVDYTLGPLPSKLAHNTTNCVKYLGVTDVKLREWKKSDLFKPFFDRLWSESIQPLMAQNDSSAKNASFKSVISALDWAEEISSGGYEIESPVDTENWSHDDWYSWALVQMRRLNSKAREGLIWGSKMKDLEKLERLWLIIQCEKVLRKKALKITRTKKNAEEARKKRPNLFADNSKDLLERHSTQAIETNLRSGGVLSNAEGTKKRKVRG